MPAINLAPVVLLSIVASSHAAQMLSFPTESVGTVSIRPEATVQFGYIPFGSSYGGGWQDHGPAAEAVTIPDGVAVRLQLDHAAANDLSWISNLSPNAIDAIDAYGVPLGDEGFERLSRLTGLRHLSLSDAELTSAIETHLPRFQELQYLLLSSNANISDTAMPAVAALPKLQSIGVHRTAVTDVGLEFLSKSRSICAVYVGSTRITDAGINALSKLPTLRALSANAGNPEFRGNEPNPSITDAGLAHLGRCRKLEHLDISGSQLTDTGLERLVVDCPNLRHLVLDHTAITSEGLRHVGLLRVLETLRCYGTSIDDSVAEHFKSLGKLRRISGDVEVSNAGAKALAALPSLERLALSSRGRGSPDDDCMASIAAMTSLKELSIQHTQITDEGFSLLAGSPTLERVQITGNRMTTRCIETLATMPNLKQVGLMSVDPRTDGVPAWKGLEGLRTLERELWLCYCPPLKVEDFARFADFTNLAHLRVEGGRPLTDTDLQHLRELKKLEFLELTSSVVSDEGVKMLGSLPSLERLFINCLATEKGLKSLSKAPRLGFLQIGSPDLSDEGVERVLHEHPALTIRRTEFSFGISKASRSKSIDGFWRKGSEKEREAINALEGKPAPGISVSRWINTDQDVGLDEYRGKVILVEFWGAWCGPCLARMPMIRSLHDEYSDQGLIIIGLHSTKEAEGVDKYVRDNNTPWTIGIDDDNQSMTVYAVPHWPSMYLIDRTGVLRIANPIDDDLEAAVQMLLKE